MSPSQPSAVMLTADRQIDRRILLAADSLQARGWQVTILAMPLDTASADDPRVVRIDTGKTVPKTENYVLDIYRGMRLCLPMNGKMMRLAKSIAWRWLVDPESFYVKLFYVPGCRYTPTVFVANDLPMLPMARKLAEKSGARLIYDSHELYCEQNFPAEEKRRWAEIEARHIGACAAVITVNRSIATELERRYELSGVYVVHSAERVRGVPPQSRRFHEYFGLQEKQRILLWQGGLSADRNLETLVAAMHHVKNESVVLVMLGDGQLQRRLARMAKSMGLQKKVYFHAAVPQADLLAHTVAADAGIIPYQGTCLNNYLCTPNKLFEFIAAGLPILGSDLPEIRQTLQENRIGMAGDTSTPLSMAALIDDFFIDEQRLALWRANLETVRRRICWECEEHKLVGIYESLR